jgi:hypothetical protein
MASGHPKGTVCGVHVTHPSFERASVSQAPFVCIYHERGHSAGLVLGNQVHIHVVAYPQVNAWVINDDRRMSIRAIFHISHCTVADMSTP